MENVELVRVNIKMPKETKEWFQREAEKYAITMSGLMAMTLTKTVENHENAKMIKEFNEIVSTVKTLNDDLKDEEGNQLSTMQIISEMREFVKMIQNTNKSI